MHQRQRQAQQPQQQSLAADLVPRQMPRRSSSNPVSFQQRQTQLLRAAAAAGVELGGVPGADGTPMKSRFSGAVRTSLSLDSQQQQMFLRQHLQQGQLLARGLPTYQQHLKQQQNEQQQQEVLMQESPVVFIEDDIHNIALGTPTSNTQGDGALPPLPPLPPLPLPSPGEAVSQQLAVLPLSLQSGQGGKLGKMGVVAEALAQLRNITG